MNILIYIAIFVFKIIEDALATLRLIVVSNGKKKLGAILQFVVTLIWIILTGTVLMGLQKDIFKAITFAFGALFGSYLGSVLEEKMALGTNVFMVEVNNDKANNLIKVLKNENFRISKIKSGNDGKIILMITGARKQTNKVVSIIQKVDNKAIILSEKVKIVQAL